VILARYPPPGERWELGRRGVRHLRNLTRLPKDGLVTLKRCIGELASIKLLGLPILDLNEGDARMVVNLNAGLDWSRANWMQ